MDSNCITSNLPAEQSVLSAALGGGRKVLADIAELTGDDFSDPRHAAIYDAIQSIWNGDGIIDEITVVAELTQQGNLQQAGGATFIMDLSAVCASYASADHHASLVLQASAARRCLEIARELGGAIQAGNAISEATATAVTALTDLSVKGDRSGPRHAGEIVRDVLVQYKAQYLAGSKPGITTGYQVLDDLTLGLKPSELTVIGARPGQGKSALGLAMACAGQEECGKPVIYFSLEMSQLELGRRLLSAQGGISATRLAQAQLKKIELARVLPLATRMQQGKLYIDDSPALSVAQIRARAHRMHTHDPLGAVFVDYLQLMRAKGENRVEQVGAMANGLKALAKELSIPVVALAQLNRQSEGRDDKTPTMSDFRESGGIEAAADNMIGLLRTKDRPDEALLNIMKSRGFKTGECILHWEGELIQFSEQKKDYQSTDLRRQDDGR